MNRWRILNIGSTEIVLHPVTVIFLLYTCFTGHLIFTLLAFLSIFLHECAHSIVSALCGQAPSRIEITPLGATMHIEDIAQLPPVKRLLTILAGPACTFLLSSLSLWSARTGLISTTLGSAVFRCNLAILLLNFLPFLPLDGGRILHLLLSLLIPRAVVTNIMKAISYLGGIALIAANVLITWKYGGWNLSLAFAGCCILYNASIFTITQAMSELRFFVDRKIHLERKGIMGTKNYLAVHTAPLRLLISKLPARQSAYFYCIEIGTQRVLGSMHEAQVIQHYLTNPAVTFAEALISTDNR